MTSNIVDLFAYEMARERIHPAQLTAKQIELRREHYGKRWAEFQRDQSGLDLMADWISEQYEAQYHENPECV